MERPSIDKLETTPTTYKTITKPRTQGININPMKKVNDPQSIRAREIPKSKDANPAGVSCCITICLLPTPADEDAPAVAGDDRTSSEKSIGLVGDLNKFKIKADNS